MQVVVTENSIKVEETLVTEEQLKIAIELLSNEFSHTLGIKLDTTTEKLKQKIKKRLKTQEYKEYIKHKVNTEEFYKQIERIDNMIQIIDDTVTHRLPALEYEFNRDLKRKADIDDMTVQLGSKVEYLNFDKLVARVNSNEEQLAE